jgi:F-box/leucine-rich repeat protein 14
LKGIAVSCKFVEDAALAMLPRFPALRALMPMDVADEGFRHVGGCEGLEELWCMYCRDTGDRATEHIAGLKLKTYYAGSTRITDRSLDILSRISSLERIELQSCQHVTNEGVSRLVALPNLRRLQVESCRNVTRAGVSGFAPTVRVSYSSI